MSDLTSKFFNGDDERIEKLDNFEIPIDWWSRPHEYAWASKFLNKDDIVLDAGCGVLHPFKFYASNKVKKVIAVDKDKELKTLDTIPSNMKLICSDICNLQDTIDSNSVDKIFCISVLEHMYPMNIIDALKEFKRILKPDGQIILTLDYPILHTDTFINLVNEAGLNFVADVDFDYDKNKVIKGTYGNLKCYRAVLCKPEEETQTTNIEPKEKKPRKPKEIK